jgi:hypothetical protein
MSDAGARSAGRRLPVTLSNIGRESGELFADAAAALPMARINAREAGRCGAMRWN